VVLGIDEFVPITEELFGEGELTKDGFVQLVKDIRPLKLRIGRPTVLVTEETEGDESVVPSTPAEDGEEEEDDDEEGGPATPPVKVVPPQKAAGDARKKGKIKLKKATPMETAVQFLEFLNKSGIKQIEVKYKNGRVTGRPQIPRGVQPS
jgi:hypothetical protein